MRRCSCDRAAPSHVWHGKKGSGTLSTHRGAVHLAGCPHSDLAKTARPYKPVRIKSIPGRRKLIAIELPEPGRELPRRSWRTDAAR